MSGPTRQKTWREVLCFSSKHSQSTVRRYYDRYRKEMGIPKRCDNDDPRCRFFDDTLEWNGKPLPVILDHRNGVRKDNRPKNLRYLCPNCDAQLLTRGGRNKGRVQMSEGGFVIRAKDGRRAYALVADPGDYRSKFREVARGKDQ